MSSSFLSGNNTPIIRSAREKPKKTADQELHEAIKSVDEMIGLGEVKAEINRLIAFARVIAVKRERGINAGAVNLHMVFTGPPGTGKTVVARKLGAILKALKLLRKGHCVEVDRSSIVGEYVGQTPKNMQEKLNNHLLKQEG